MAQNNNFQQKQYNKALPQQPQNNRNQNNNNQQQKNYGQKNQYHPKAKQELYEDKKAHVYSMRGTYDSKQGKLNIFVFDQMNGNEWEQYFTQNAFKNMKLFDVAKQTIDSINSTMNGGVPLVTIQEWNGIAYLTVQGGKIPTLALPKKQ
eukprot:396544_1